MDDLDRAILRILQEDSRKSFREISKEVDSTPVTVINRVRKMEDKGVIRGYSVDLDYEKLGYGMASVIGIVTEGSSIQEICESLADQGNISHVFEVTGDTDIIIVARFRDMGAMQDFIKTELLGMEGVKTVTQVVTDIYKDSPTIEILEEEE